MWRPWSGVWATQIYRYPYKKLPTLYGYHEHVEAGGLVSYGVNLDGCWVRAAYYVDKILKGAVPACV